jgi:hypothetical protein
MAAKGSLISAAEVGEYVFCARSWQLRATGHENAKARPALEAGTHYHEQHGQGVERAHSFSSAAKLCVLAALVLTLLFLLFEMLR